MEKNLRIQCNKCQDWNELAVEEVFLNPDMPEPKVKAFLRAYQTTQTQKCTNCNVVLCEPDEIFRLIEYEAVRYKMRYLKNSK